MKNIFTGLLKFILFLIAFWGAISLIMEAIIILNYGFGGKSIIRITIHGAMLFFGLKYSGILKYLKKKS